MRLLLRVDDGAGGVGDLDIELADGTTVGELADHLGARVGAAPGGSVSCGPADVSAPLPRDASVADLGPRSGSTVRLVPVDAGAGTADAPRPVPSTVRLVPLDRRRPDRRLPYGTSSFGGMQLIVDERIELRATTAATGTVDGVRVVGSRWLRDGQILASGDDTATLQIDGPLEPPRTRGVTRTHRATPVAPHTITSRVVDLPVAPGAARVPGLPLLSASVPLVLGLGLWAVTRSVATGAFVLFSVVFVLAAGIEARRESRAEQRFRVAEFRADLDEAAEQVDRAHRDEQRRSAQRWPAPEQLRSIVHGERLWERRAGATAMEVRVGHGRREPATTCRASDQGRRDLRRAARTVADERRSIELPVTIDLDHTGGLAVAGPDEATTAVARSIVSQLAALVAPDDLAIEVLTAASRRDTWRWVQWLPHAHGAPGVRRTLLVVDGAADHDVDEVLLRHGPAVRLLWLCGSAAGLPDGLDTVLEISGGPHPSARVRRHVRSVEDTAGDDRRAADRTTSLTLDQLEQDEAERLARAMAGIRIERSTVRLPGHHHRAPGPDRDGMPDAVPLVDLVAWDHHEDGAEQIAVAWSRHDGDAGLIAPVGRAGRGVWHVDLHADGPHALIAGTTGSGKSELLRTLVTSMALHHRPQRLTFLLVDYKGGAAFGPLADLPHTTGVLTDLDPALAARALRSLRAEVRRRERVLAELAADDLTGARRRFGTVHDRVPPALVVVVDEFATLARELPEFVEGLVDVAQRGRSLGVHLVLATQRPAGVVSDAIRANTTLRLALRVADEQDSRDVVDVPDAAAIPRAQPGRAMLRSGLDAPTAVQVASCSLPPTGGARLRSWPLGDRPAVSTPTASPEQLPRLVRAIRDAASASGLAPPRRPWVEPLPEHVEHRNLPVGAPGRLVLGWIDRPDEQRHAPLELDLDRHGGVLVLGASGSGRTHALATIVHAATRPGAWPDQDVLVHVIDAGDGLTPLRGTPGVGDVIGVDDHERVLRLLRSMHADLCRRSGRASSIGGARTARRLLVIDGLGVLEEVHAGVNRGEATDLVERLARDGRRVGLHVVASATRRTDARAALAAVLGWHLVLRSAHGDDAALLGLDPASAHPEVPPGRGHVHGEPVQLARWQPTGAPVHATTGEHRVPRLPLRVTRGELPAAPDTADGSLDRDDPWASLVVGVDADEVRPVALDLRHDHLVVAGPPRSGRTSTLATVGAALVDAAAERGSPARLLTIEVTRAALDGAAVADQLDHALDLARAGHPTLVALDGVTALADRAGVAPLEAAAERLLAASRELPVRLAVADDLDALGRCYLDLLVRLRAGRTGVLLRPDVDLHGGLLHTTLPRRDELAPAAGRGWLVQRDRCTALQIALPELA